MVKPLMANIPSELDEVFAFQMNMNKTQKTKFKASVSPLPIKGETFSTIQKNY